MQQKDESSLIRSIKGGEIENFSSIVHAYTDQIYNYIHKKLFEKNDAEDIVQEVFLSFYKHIDKFDENAPVLPYLFGIAKNELKMYFRSKKITVPLDERITASEMDPEPGLIEESLKILPAEQRKPLELLYEGYTYQEIARKLSKPLSTVKTIVHRARLKLKKDYEKTGR